MKTFITGFFLLTSLSGFAIDKACPIKIDPGISFGPIKLGMTREEVKKLGLPEKKTEMTRLNQQVGNYTLQYDEKGFVIDIGSDIATLPDCLYMGKRKINRMASSKELARIFKDCKKEEVRLGGNLTHCHSIWIQTGGWGGRQRTPIVRTHLPTYGAEIITQ